MHWWSWSGVRSEQCPRKTGNSIKSEVLWENDGARVETWLWSKAGTSGWSGIRSKMSFFVSSVMGFKQRLKHSPGQGGNGLQILAAA